MKALFASALFLLCVFGPAPSRAADADTPASKLTYTLEPVVSGTALRMGVGLSFTGDDTGKTRLHLPSHFAGQGKLYENVHELAAVSPGVTVADTGEPSVKEVTFPPGQTVSLHYWVAGDAVSHARQAGGYFRPALLPGWFSLIGATFWVYPSQYAPTLTATLHWKMPAGWTLCDSLGAGAPDQEFTGTMEQFRETVYVGGDFRVRTADVDGHPVTVAVRGRWKFSDEELADTAARILRTERDFWQDHDFPYYLVALIPTEGAAGNVRGEGGVELTRAVALFQPPGRALDFGLKYVLAHEAFHNWNADQIQSGPTPLYWFSEGITDYDSRLLLLRAGLISPDDYARDYNRILREYWVSPTRNSRSAEASRAFYAGGTMAKLPYEQGALLAAHWDAAIRQATSDKKSLEDVLCDLRKAALTGGTGITAAQVAEAIRQYAPLDPAEEVQKGVEEGATIAPDPHGLGPGFSLRPIQLAPFALGFDMDATLKQQIVTGVVPGSHASGAGLRDGEELISCLPYTEGDPSQRITLSVRDGDNTREIQYTPCGDSVSVPQYVRDSSVSDAACRAWFGNPPMPSGR